MTEPSYLPPPPPKSSRKTLVIALVIVIVVAAAVVGGYLLLRSGISNPPASTPTSTPTATATPTPTPTPTLTPTPTPKPEPEAIILTGVGQKVSSSFVLEKGVAIFTLTHDGNSNFIIWLYSKSGDREELIVNEIGEYSGSIIVGVGDNILQVSAGEHLLEVDADGNWQVTITQPRPHTAPKIPQTFTGTGSKVPAPFTLETGLVKFEMTHDGSSNFIIWLYSSEGEPVELLVNEIGDYEGSVLLGVTGDPFEASPGIHYLSIQADGYWTVTITST